ncbi:hypothetical protein [Micromonospora globispora]|uniref:hypothetical protein n=1 Tax=Micromonospora globispora TaxID=1450148 RepID=UPI001FAF835E|nr:hypothetical protein [Micromonospora globispora]
MTSTIGASGASERPMSVTGAMPVALASNPGTCTRIGSPGLNPSCRFHSVWSIGTPRTLVGIEEASNCTRLPVGLAGSGTVK